MYVEEWRKEGGEGERERDRGIDVVRGREVWTHVL